jgi:DNA-binding NarL/FixJ family response regulator
MEITYDRPLWLGAQNGQLIEAGRQMLPTSLEFVPHAVSIPPDSQLTERQHDVLVGLQGAHTNRQIAYHLHISESTIGKETIEIYRKLRVKTRRDAVLTAEAIGLLTVAGEGGHSI